MYFGVFGTATKEEKSPLIDRPAPDFKLETFDGKSIDLSDLHGNVVVMNFWASWCIPCQSEVDVLENATNEYRNMPVSIIGVNIWDDRENAVDFINKYNADFVNTYDPKGHIQVDFGVRGVPETFFINKDGIIIKKYSGQITGDMLHKLISEILAGKKGKDV